MKHLYNIEFSGQDISVYEHKGSSPDSYGDYDPDPQEINLYKAQSPRYKLYVLFHEIVHGILESNGWSKNLVSAEQEEQMAQSIGWCMVDIFCRNPAFVKDLNRRIKTVAQDTTPRHRDTSA